MKKWTALVLSFVLVLSMAACSSRDKAYYALDEALAEKQYSTKVTIGGNDMESIVKELNLTNVKTAASISFKKDADKAKTSGFANIYIFKNEADAVTGFANILKVYLSAGLSFNTMESDNGKKAVYQDGNTALIILTQAGDTVIYSTEYWETAPKDGVYEAGLGKILEKIGY